MNGREHSKLESWVALASIALLALACLLIILPFISAAVWAAILCFSTWPVFIRLLWLLNGRRSLAAIIATLELAAVIVMPFAIVGVTLAFGLIGIFIGPTVLAVCYNLLDDWSSGPVLALSQTPQPERVAPSTAEREPLT